MKATAIAKMATDKAAQTTEQLRRRAEEKDWSKESEYIGRAQKAAVGCAIFLPSRLHSSIVPTS